MDISSIEKICLNLPHVDSEIKWKSDLVFMIARKMFCLVDLDAVPTTVAFKVSEEEFDEMSTQPNFKPAPYFARHQWVTVANIEKITISEWQLLLGNSYQLVKDRLSKKAICDYGIE